MKSNNVVAGTVVTSRFARNHTRSLLWLSIGALALLIVIALVALAVVARELQAARDSHAASERTREVLNHVRTVLSASRDAETGERGFVITGNEAFLQPYALARELLRTDLQQLQAFALDEDTEMLIAELELASREQLAFIEAVIQVRRTQGEARADELVSQQIGKERMDRIRALGERIIAREEALLEQRLATFAARSARSESVVQIGLLASILLVLIAGVLLVRHTQQRVRAEEEARAAYAILSATIDHVSQGIAVFDEHRRLIVCNAQFVAVRGLGSAVRAARTSLEEIANAGATLYKALSNGTREQISELSFSGEEFDVEAVREDGATLLMRARKMPHGGFVITLLDVTAMKNTEVAYRDQAVRLTSILDNVVDAIITINESGSIESWSKGAQRLFGYEASEVLRRNVKMLMPDPHRTAHDGYLRRYMQIGERRIIGTRREVLALTKSGQEVPVDLGISEMRLGDRRLFIGIVRDISARLEVERLKAGFVSTVSHELRTPLTSIAGSLGLLAGGVAGGLPAKAVRLIDIAKLNCERLVLLINDILDLERAESGRLDMRLESQALRPIVQQAIELNRSFAHNFGVSIELEPGTEDATVLVDRDRLIQVLTNLLSNAAKFSPRGDTVRVRLHTASDSIAVSVRDNGPGISPQFSARIFQRFAQADSSDSRAKGGTGLGLSISKAIIEKLGGTIGFESEPGKGSDFHISLPLRHQAASYEKSTPGARSSATILICEDDPDIAALFAETLRAEGIQIVAVPTAKAAREAIMTRRFDLALIDLHLPDAEGLEFIAELRSHQATSRLPIVVTTASASGASRPQQISALQLADWLQKPIDPRRLLEAIHNVLARPRLGRARILHVEDDESLTLMVRELLEEESDITAVHSLADAKRAVTHAEYDLVILDIGLGDGSGLDVLPLLRMQGRTSPPVILYSATEASREVTEMVEAALVKSRDSVEQLLASVRTLALRAS